MQQTVPAPGVAEDIGVRLVNSPAWPAPKATSSPVAQARAPTADLASWIACSS